MSKLEQQNLGREAQLPASNGAKRILIFSLAYFPKPVGGAEVAVKEITDRMSDTEFHLVTLRFDRERAPQEKIRNVTVHRIGFGGGSIFNKLLFQFYAPFHARRLHRKHAFDCQWAIMAHSAGVPAAIFKWFYPEIPYVLTLQEGDTPEYIEKKMLPLWPLFARAFTCADVITAISSFLGVWARKRGFKGPLHVVHNGVDIQHFSREFPKQTIDEIKDKLGKNMGDVFLVTTSRLVEKNAIDDCIAALPRLPHNVKFMILGVGPLEARLKNMVLKENLTARVKFLGHVGHEDLPKYLAASDIFIRASRSEGMGNSFVEAMAAGLPVIATQEGGIADFLFDEKRNPDKPVTGFAVDKNSPQSIVAAVTYVIEHPEKVRGVIATAKAMVTDEYNWDSIARTMKEHVFLPLFSK